MRELLHDSCDVYPSINSTSVAARGGVPLYRGHPHTTGEPAGPEKGCQRDKESDAGARRGTSGERNCSGNAKVSPADVPVKCDNGIFFKDIRAMCEPDMIDPDIDMSPKNFACNRKQFWPAINDSEMDNALSVIYEKTRATGLPNAMKARQLLPSNLNIDNWEKYIDDSPDERELLSFIKYGFPLGYMGPTSDTEGISNHKSATDFPIQVDHFISKELDMGGIMGPLVKPPFKEWCHVSPLMSREKRGTSEGRVIIDMTYPPETSVNSYIFKNTVMGAPRDHALPNVDSFVCELKRIGNGAYMSSTDVSRAYKNFRSDPLDWPLLAFKWRDSFYCDVSMPFGARASSCHMQRVANAITRMLMEMDVVAKMYIDDLILISPTREKAVRDLQVAQKLLSDLGLPEAPDKVQAPSTRVTWLGVVIDSVSMSISVPLDKLEEIKACVCNALKMRSMTKKHLQSIIGKVIHVAKCIRPARLFVSRLLEALRGMKKKYLKVTPEMRDDLLWFKEFSAQWNGVGLINTHAPDMDVYVDASGSGIGGYDGRTAYGGQVTPQEDPARNISELEAVNLTVALQTFLSEQDRGRHIRVFCDNMPTVEVCTTGRGKHPIILECARSIWMLQALFDVEISYEHIAGTKNVLADALSRRHLDKKFQNIAMNSCRRDNLAFREPCLHIFTVLKPSLLSRNGVSIAPTQSSSTTTAGEGARHGC